MENRLKNIGRQLTDWYVENKRDLPWRHTKDPYKIWISEIMLQQTRVDTVIDYYNSFLERFPDIFALAAADEQEVLSAWKGLGYYSRARSIHKAACILAEKYAGAFPREYDKVRELPGIGAYTAGAILSIAFNQPHAAVDGNVLRVISRIECIEADIGLDSTKKLVSRLVLSMLPEGRAEDFIQALMELGALVCTPSKPQCGLCPVKLQCTSESLEKQNFLPVKKRDKAPKEIYFWAPVILKDGLILLEHRKDETLLAQMWGLPMVEKSDGETEEELLFRKYGLKLKKIKKLDMVKHIFSHQVWYMDAAVFTLSEEDALRPTLRWVSRPELDKLAVPTAFQKVLMPVLFPVSGDSFAAESSEEYGI